MRTGLFTAILLFTCTIVHSQAIQRVYLLPGQGSDHRIYSNIVFPDGVDTVQLHFLQPALNESMEAYATRMAAQIDTTLPFAIIGVSLGGMVTMEMSDIVHPDTIILLSSATSSEEIPGLYHYFEGHPIYQYIPPPVIKYATFILQPVYEPDRSAERAICNSMIYRKDADFMRDAVHMIVTWDRMESENVHTPVLQIHGTADHTLPVDAVDAHIYIENGSHMMTLTRGAELTPIIAKALGY